MVHGNFLIRTARWGGNPEEAATYVNVVPDKNDKMIG